MKQIYLFILFTIIVLPSVAQISKEQDKNSESMMPIVEGLYKTIATLEKENVKIIRIEFDHISSKKISTRTLTNSYTYGVMVYGDYRIKRINVRILLEKNNKWILVADGENNGSSSIAHIEPKNTDNYIIEVEVTEFNETFSKGHYGLIIIHN